MSINKWLYVYLQVERLIQRECLRKKHILLSKEEDIARKRGRVLKKRSYFEEERCCFSKKRLLYRTSLVLNALSLAAARKGSLET